LFRETPAAANCTIAKWKRKGRPNLQGEEAEVFVAFQTKASLKSQKEIRLCVLLRRNKRQARCANTAGSSQDAKSAVVVGYASTAVNGQHARTAVAAAYASTAERGPCVKSAVTVASM
jgi:hypothetical protein